MFNPLIFGLFSDPYFKVLWKVVTLNFLIFFLHRGICNKKFCKFKHFQVWVMPKKEAKQRHGLSCPPFPPRPQYYWGVFYPNTIRVKSPTWHVYIIGCYCSIGIGFICSYLQTRHDKSATLKFVTTCFMSLQARNIKSWPDIRPWC